MRSCHLYYTINSTRTLIKIQLAKKMLNKFVRCRILFFNIYAKKLINFLKPNVLFLKENYLTNS